MVEGISKPMQIKDFVDLELEDGTILTAEERRESSLDVKEKQLMIRSIREQVLSLFHKKEFGEGTELLVTEIKKNNYIYTTKVDKASEVYIYREGIYVPEGESEIKEQLRRIMRDNYNEWIANQVMSKIKTDTGISSEEFFKDSNLYEIPVQNGILNLKTLELLQFNHEKIFFSKLPVNYTEGETCPMIDKFLTDVLSSPTDKDVFYELVGFGLVKDYFLEKSFMFVGNGRNGKCQKGSDKVLMENGEWKEIQNIKIGEKIISPQKDGSSRICKIINTHNRFEENVYDVVEKNRDKKLLYTCAGNHTIPIIRTYSERTSKDDSTPRKRERKLFEYDAEHISKLDNSKSKICSFTSTAVEYNKKDAIINPYCLGAWLGDGHFRSIRVQKKNWKGMQRKGKRFSHNGNHLQQGLGITTMDSEIINEFYRNYSDDNIKKTTKPNNKASTYRLSVIGKFAKQLTKLRLNGKGSGDKFIPKECLLSSINYRKNLLAGLIDTDGFVQKKTGATYYVTKSKRLAEDIKTLVFSLGGYCKINIITKKCQNGFVGNYFELSLQFQDYDIPLRLERKSIRFSERKYSPRNIAIECIKTNPQQVYGIEIEGDSKWYVTNDWMVTHNSKSIELLKRLVGVGNCASVPLSAITSDSPFVQRLWKRFFNLAGDISSKDLKETGMFKQLTGRDPISANRKYKNIIEFTNYAKMVFACNDLPRVYDYSDGFWERWVLMEFPYKFVDQNVYDAATELEKEKWKIKNPNIIEEITTPQEMAGFLNMAILGLYRLFNNKKFSYTKGTQEVKEKWIRMADSFMAFCMDSLEEDYEGKITKKELRKKYKDYCFSHKVKGSSDKSIKITLQEMFGVSEGYGQVYGSIGQQEYLWTGIKFKKEK